MKLRALVADRWGVGDLALAPFPGGAVGRRGSAGWVLAEERPERALGGALAWGRQAGVDELHVLVGHGAGALARQALAFARAPVVWRVEGRTLEPSHPAPVTTPEPLDAAVAGLIPMIAAAGAEPVVEHGVLTGEVLGLEVARVVSDEMGTRLEVGVGAYDREARRLLRGDRSGPEALVAAVQSVREVRRPGAPSHQVNQLSGERWLRSILVRRPELVGATYLEPVPSPVVRADLRQLAPAPAAGVDDRGRPLLVVCSAGIDVNLVPAAAAARLSDGRQPRLVLVVPEIDDHPLTRSLAAALREPAEVMAVPGDWRDL